MDFIEHARIMKGLDAKHEIMTPRMLIDWVAASPCEFSISDISTDRYLQYRYLEMCENMVKLDMLERSRDRRGSYRPVNGNIDEMDLENAIDAPVEMSLPFEMHDLVEIYPGNIIIVAGAKSAGKTALMLNVIRDNENHFENTHYFNSEMGAPEMKKRLGFFDRTIDMWKNLKAYERSSDFGSVVKGGEGNLNIIDFLEVHGGEGDQFYQIGGKIRQIHDNLNGAICIICIQKNPGLDLPLGGSRAIEKARLVITLDKGRVKIYDAKNWKSETNPNGLQLDFKLIQGTKIRYRRDDKHHPQWKRETKEKKGELI